LFPGRSGGFLANNSYRYQLDKATAAMQGEATTARQREIAESGKATTPEFPDITSIIFVTPPQVWRSHRVRTPKWCSGCLGDRNHDP
jgi:hypothetical protein